MPDNIDKYNIDDDFVDAGWEQMKNLLDANMPEEKKKKRIIPFWWWLGSSIGIAAAMLCGWLILQPTAKNDLHYVECKVQDKLNDKIASNDIRNNPVQIITTNEPNKSAFASSETTNTNIKSASFYATKQVLTPISNNEVADNSISINTLPNPMAVSVTNTVVPMEQPIVGRMNPSTLSTIPMLNLHLADRIPVPIYPNPHFEDTKKNIVSSKALLHGISLRGSYFTTQQYAFSVSYTLKKTIDTKNNIQARIGAEYHTLKLPVVTASYTIPANVLDNKSIGNTSQSNDTTIYNIAYPYTTANLAKDYALSNNIAAKYYTESNNNLQTNYIVSGAEIAYGYSCFRKLELTAGLGYIYRIKSITRSQSSLEKVNSSSALDNNPSYLKEAITQNELTHNINRQDVYLTAGVNYYFTKKFNVGIGFRKGFIDFTKNDPLNTKSNLNFGYLQSVFYF